MKLTHKTNANKKSTYIYTAVVFLFLILFYILASIPVINSGLWQMIAFVFFVFSAYFLSRFYLTDFTYVLTDSEFIVIKNVGKKDTKVCHLENRFVLDLYTKDEWKIKKEQIPCVYNYNARYLPKEYYVLVFDIGKGRVGVKTQITSEMYESLSEIIHGETENL